MQLDPGVADVTRSLWHGMQEIVTRLHEQRVASRALHEQALAMAKRTVKSLQTVG